MKYTTTLQEILEGELHSRGFNEFWNEGRITSNDPKYVFMKKIMRYDEDVQTIVNDILFQDMSLEDKDADIKFKKMFLNRNLNKQIAYQTVEVFSSKILSDFLILEDAINYTFKNAEDLLSSGSSSSNTGKQKNGATTLPQSEIDFDLGNAVMSTADAFGMNIGEGSSKNSSNDYNTVAGVSRLYEGFLRKFDKHFLKLW